VARTMAMLIRALTYPRTTAYGFSHLSARAVDSFFSKHFVNYFYIQAITLCSSSRPRHPFCIKPTIYPTKQHIMQNSKPTAKNCRPTAQTVVPNSNATEDAQAQASSSRPNQVPSSESNTDTGTDTVAGTVSRRGRGDTKSKSKLPRNTTSGQAATSQSLPLSDAGTSDNGNASPPTVRGQAALQAFLHKFPSTADDPPAESRIQDRNISEVLQPAPSVANPHASRPGAFAEGRSLYPTQTTTNHTPNPASVPST
jgi:hypothetical protein